MSARINKVKEAGSKMRDEAHLNWMAGLSYDINDPFNRLHLIAASSFFGEPQYYNEGDKGLKKLDANSHSRQCQLSNEEINYLRDILNALDPREWRSMSPKQIIEKTIDDCLSVDIEKTLQVAVKLRNEDNIRVTPQVIMVRAAMCDHIKGTGLIGRYASEIIKRGDEPATQMAYFFSEYGDKGKRGVIPIPSRLRKAWKNALEKLDEYRLAKYRMESRAVKTIDVVRLVHANSEPINKLVNNELVLTDKTWEAIISKEGSNKASWEKALEVMPHMALLRNIRNLLENKIDPHLFMDKLVSGVATGKQLPFRYYSAYKAVGDGNAYVLDKLEECLELSFVNLPHFNGRVMSLSDNSGSAWGAVTSEYGTMTVAEIGNLTSVITAKASDEGYVGVFGDRLDIKSIRQKSSIFDELGLVNQMGKNIGSSTETGIWLFWDKAIKNKEHWDHVFIYSDMQAGHGGLYTNSGSHSPVGFVWNNRSTFVDVPKLIATYRAQVNPNVQVFLVQTAGYQDTLLPEYYSKTYILGGWSGNILNFAGKMAGIVK